MACDWFKRGRERKVVKDSSVPSPPNSLPMKVIRVTYDGGVLNRTYSYWSNTYVQGDDAFLFVGHTDGKVRFFRINLLTEVVEQLSLPFNYPGTGEGWYWDAEGWLYLTSGPRLHRVNPRTGEDTVVMDIENAFSHHRIWQTHSSVDGLTHNGTVEEVVENGPYRKIGTIIQRNGIQRFFPSQGELDESQVDASGRFLIVKESFQRDKLRLDNRFVDLDTGTDEWLNDEDGAIGHSDCGNGFVVGEDDQVGACVWINLQNRAERRSLFSTWNMGAVSVMGSKCLLSDSTHVGLVSLDGSGVTPLLAHGMTGEGYDFQVRANLSPCGRVAMYVSNAGGGFDAYIVRLPVDK